MRLFQFLFVLVFFRDFFRYMFVHVVDGNCHSSLCECVCLCACWYIFILTSQLVFIVFTILGMHFYFPCFCSATCFMYLIYKILLSYDVFFRIKNCLFVWHNGNAYGILNATQIYENAIVAVFFSSNWRRFKYFQETIIQQQWENLAEICVYSKLLERERERHTFFWCGVLYIKWK